MQQKYLLLAALCLLAAAACHNKNEDHDHGTASEAEAHAHEGEAAHGEIVLSPERAREAGVEVETIQPGKFSSAIRTSGVLSPSGKGSATVTSLTSGILSWNGATPVPGQRVSDGETIARVSAGGMGAGDAVTRAAIAFEADSGQYIIHHNALDINKKYCVQVKTGGKTYQSEFMQPLQTPPIDTLYWYKENTEAPVDILLSTHDHKNQLIYYMWTFREDWEIIPRYNTTQYAIETRMFNDYIRDYEERPNPYYHCWNRMISRNILVDDASRYTDNQIIDYPIQTFPCTDERVCYLYCISVTQQALDEQAYQYYQNKKKMTEEMGSIFAPMPSELQGNITCIENPDEPVIGYIHVTIPTHKRLFVTREEVFLDNKDCQLFTEDYLIEEHLKTNIFPPGPADLLAKGYRYVYNGTEGIGGKLWARVECVECTAYGTKEKPDFWPNDHE